jgi:uncharacterized protein YidB (DUF937 family)
MGLLDILNGMQNGPRGASPSDTAGSGSGMSPMTMALVGLLAYKAIKSFTGASASQSAPAAAPPPPDTGATSAAASLSDALPGGLGSLLGGASAGSLVSGGLATLVREFQNGGHGGAAQSWVSAGPNEAIAPQDLAKVLGPDALDTLSRQTGMNRDDLLAGLSQHLPELINQLTPHGRLPTQEEASRMA